MHHDAIIILKLALNAHNWPAHKLYFIFAFAWMVDLHVLQWSSIIPPYLDFSVIVVKKKKKKFTDTYTTYVHNSALFKKQGFFQSVYGQDEMACMPPTPNTLHLECIYHLHSSHRFLSTWCGKQKMPVQKHILYLPIRIFGSGLMMILNQTCTHTNLITVIS